MSEELKPCPFCGNEVEVENFVGMESGAYITCSTCRRTYICADRDGIKLWNTRRIEDALTAERDALGHELFLHQERVKELEEERRWVPVKEKLPDEGIDVLAVDGLSDPFIAFREEQQWWRVCEPLGNGEQAVHWAQVTMWMDLPAGFLEVEP